MVDAKPVLYLGPFGALHVTVEDALQLDQDVVLLGAQYVILGSDGLHHRIDPRDIRSSVEMHA